MALKNNTWKLNQWYDQSVAGNVDYTGTSELWGWGQNENGGLGLNSRTDYSSPIQISSNTTWNFPPSGGTHTAETQVLVKTDGTLWSWGYNYNGMLGQNSPVTTHLSSPTQIPGTTWSTAVMTRTNPMATKTDGTLWTWGNNQSGVFGIPSYAHNAKVSSPVQVPGTTWDKIYHSNTHVSAIKTDGTLWTWGNNSYAQLGLNTPARSSPTQIPGTTWARVGSGDETGLIATKTDGTLWAWGYNYFGGLGQNNTTTAPTPLQVGTDTTWDYTADYKLGCGQPSARFAIKTDGTLWSWGLNNYGHLGVNNITSYSSPIQVPGTNWKIVSASYGRYTMAIKTDNTLWNWGDNSSWMGGAYYADNPSQPTQRSSPVQVPGDWGSVIAQRRNVLVQKVL